MNDDDESLFSKAMQGVKTLSSNKANLKRKPDTIKKREAVMERNISDTLSDEFIPECENFLEFKRPGIQNAYLKQIRNGKIEVSDYLDLHGYRRDDARKTLLEFLDHAQQHSYKLVRIVHGKGYHSDESQPILKAMVNKWLQSIPEVLAFVSAVPKDGGTGAVYVLLKVLKP
ncbi:MAG: DNA mismatch repair protein MutS [endosymbiont of Galathealinum brachiosum]|uniref:DNA mismatch repair protein MutS n=1 Tax=endosymbiont of Galathealinum brachiosum TaxID=2200906 RepID=A0A370DK98_9GAMM|nr:MAG: DNA mismatch repair protein MutS [endosymbiont of Galathealinum brachiosum]